MSAGINIPACHSARNRTTISGNQVLCASPEGISQDLQLSRPFSVSAVFIIVADVSGRHGLYRRVARYPRRVLWLTKTPSDVKMQRLWPLRAHGPFHDEFACRRAIGMTASSFRPRAALQGK